MSIPLVFSHANSFPAGTYRLMFEQLEQAGYEVFSVDKFGHQPNYPVTDQWPHLVRQLHELTEHVHAQCGQAPLLVGHSLGGMLSLMSAAQHPEHARGVVLLDSPVVAGWRAEAMRWAKINPFLRQRFMPSAISQKRRTHWDSREHAHAHFEAKRKFARWDQRVLHDYMAAGLEPTDSGVTLSFDREIETRIYDTVPHSLGRLMHRSPPRCPVAFIGGTESRELRQAGMSGVRMIPNVEIRMMEGTHLFPMEKPHETSQLLCELLGGMVSATAVAG